MLVPLARPQPRRLSAAGTWGLGPQAWLGFGSIWDLAWLGVGWIWLAFAGILAGFGLALGLIRLWCGLDLGGFGSISAYSGLLLFTVALA